MGINTEKTKAKAVVMSAKPKRRVSKAVMLLVAALLVGTPVAYYFGSIAQFNADQAQVYALTAAQGNWLLATGAQARAVPNGTCSGSSCSVRSAQTGEFSISVYFAASSFSRLFADQATFSNGTSLISKGFIPDCQSWCFGGIRFYLDPTYIIPNQGRDFQQAKLFSKPSALTGNIKNDNATIVYTSTSSTVPAATDTYAAGPCQASNIYTTSESGFGAGTVTPGTPGVTTTITVAVTITFSGTTSSLPTACLLTETTAGTHPYVYGEGQIGPFTFNNGDSMTLTWSDALT